MDGGRNSRHYQALRSIAHRLALEGKVPDRPGWRATDWGAGYAEGYLEGLAESVLRRMALRGLELSADDERRVSECRDLDVLRGWFDPAVSASGPPMGIDESASAG